MVRLAAALFPALSATITVNGGEMLFDVPGDKLPVPLMMPAGWGTKKEWTINGNVNDNAGTSMKTGGKITINGNARYRVGWLVGGGQITVNGNVDEQAGMSMRGVDIRINGSCNGIGRDVEGGNVYHNGRQIYGNGGKVSP